MYYYVYFITHVLYIRIQFEYKFQQFLFLVPFIQQFCITIVSYIKSLLNRYKMSLFFSTKLELLDLRI